MASKHLFRRLVSSPWIHSSVFADSASYTCYTRPHFCGIMCHNWWARISGCWMVCDTEGSKDMTSWDAWTPQYCFGPPGMHHHYRTLPLPWKKIPFTFLDFHWKFFHRKHTNVTSILTILFTDMLNIIPSYLILNLVSWHKRTWVQILTWLFLCTLLHVFATVSKRNVHWVAIKHRFNA